jgi:hypothetical protein
MLNQHLRPSTAKWHIAIRSQGNFYARSRHHPDVIELREDAKAGLVGVWAKMPLPAWDHDVRLEDIDRSDVEILSNPPIYSRVDEHALELCRLANDALAATYQRDSKLLQGVRASAIQRYGSRATSLPCGIFILHNVLYAVQS